MKRIERILSEAHLLSGYRPDRAAETGEGLAPIARSVFVAGMNRYGSHPGDTPAAAEGGRFLEGYWRLDLFMRADFQHLSPDRQQVILVLLAGAMDGASLKDGGKIDIGDGGRAELANRIDLARWRYYGEADIFERLAPEPDSFAEEDDYRMFGSRSR